MRENTFLFFAFFRSDFFFLIIFYWKITHSTLRATAISIFFSSFHQKYFGCRYNRNCGRAIMDFNSTLMKNRTIESQRPSKPTATATANGHSNNNKIDYNCRLNSFQVKLLPIFKPLKIKFEMKRRRRRNRWRKEENNFNKSTPQSHEWNCNALRVDSVRQWARDSSRALRWRIAWEIHYSILLLRFALMSICQAIWLELRHSQTRPGRNWSKSKIEFGWVAISASAPLIKPRKSLNIDLIE